MLYKDRVIEAFRSMYAQRPTQSSVLRRSLGFNAEVTEYACISRFASCDQEMLAQEGIIERIPELSARVLIKSPSPDSDYLHYNYRGGEILTLFRPHCLRFFLFFFQDVEECSCSADYLAITLRGIVLSQLQRCFVCRYVQEMLTYRVTVFQPGKPKEVKCERKDHDEIIWSRTQYVCDDGRHSRIFPAPCSLWKRQYR